MPPKDSLSKTVTETRLKDFCEDMFFGTPYWETEKMKEVFPATFKNTRLYLHVLRNSHAATHTRHLYPALYAFDSTTGDRITFNADKALCNFRNTSMRSFIYTDDKAFCDFLNASLSPVSRLDKAFLYLFLYLQISRGPFSTSHPTRYPCNKIHEDSKFADDMALNSFFYIGSVYTDCTLLSGRPALTVQDHYDKKMCEGYKASVPDKIVIMASRLTGCRPTVKERYRCTFSFNTSSMLTGVAIDTLR